MTTPLPVSRSSRAVQPAPSIKLPSLAEIVTSKGNGLPNRYILHATEGWGKTSLGAHAPHPVFIQTKGETGLETLINQGIIPETPHLPECQTWTELRRYVQILTTEDHPYKTLVLDTINGAERLCHEDVCAREFGGDWGDKGFLSYGKGPDVAISEWRLFLSELDKLRITKRMTIFCLCHTRVQGFKNPEGPDYDRYQPDVHKTTWAVTAKWADAILFGNFEVTIDTEKGTKRTRGLGGKQRILYTERSAAYDAKNRLGLPQELLMGTNAAEGWEVFASAVKASKITAVAATEEVKQ